MEIKPEQKQIFKEAVLIIKDMGDYPILDRDLAPQPGEDEGVRKFKDLVKRARALRASLNPETMVELMGIVS